MRIIQNIKGKIPNTWDKGPASKSSKNFKSMKTLKLKVTVWMGAKCW